MERYFNIHVHKFRFEIENLPWLLIFIVDYISFESTALWLKQFNNSYLIKIEEFK